MYIEKSLTEVIKEVKNVGLFTYIPTLNDTKENNLTARDAANDFYINFKVSSALNLHGYNETEGSLITKVNGEDYIIPADCRFFSYDIKDITAKLEFLSTPYDLVLLDPPWWNKYIRRKKAKCEKAG